MARLEDITVDSKIQGLVTNETVEVVAAQWFGNDVVEVTYKDSRGLTGSQLLYRENEADLVVVTEHLPWSFDVDGNTMRLVSEAYRIELAHIFDPYLAVHTSSVEPLPHQISAVYQEMLKRLPLRYILADDPGADKTIMTGLLLKELIARGDLKRCLIVSPGSLAENWQDELSQKFHLRFDILTNDRVTDSVGNVFYEIPFCIARLDKLARNKDLQKLLRATYWDLVVVDEAHKMSASIWGNEIKYTRRFQLGRLLSETTRHFLLLTATPHNGKEQDFQLFLSLIDQDRFEGVARSSHHSIDISDIMRRLVKEELLRFDGTPLFPERRADTVNYDLSPLEACLYEKVTTYVQEEFNRADQLDEKRRHTVGFALTILQRRLASSPEAIYQSLHRRRERLENRLSEEMLGKRATQEETFDLVDDDDMDEDDFTPEELERAEDNISSQMSASRTVQELKAEIETLKELEKLANDVRASGKDRKWDELCSLLQNNSFMFTEEHRREKLIVFTEHRDTLRYLEDKIRQLLGSDDAIVTIHGGMVRDERRKVERRFTQDKDVSILIATDAAGEGINLQRAHLMINYDLPWNPNRIEQRFGRIHRIGQTEVCRLWNLVSKETREGMVFQKLFEKLEVEREALKGKVFDILGKITYDNKPLKDLLYEAIRYGNSPEVRARLLQKIDNSVSRANLQKLIEEDALTEDSMDVSQVMKIRAEMERIEAHKLQPHFIGAFFLEAFKRLGGQINRREHNRYEIRRVPNAIRSRDMLIGFTEPVLQKYERICFDKGDCTVQGAPMADLVCPEHPLLEATIDLIRERNSDVLKRGSIFVDETDFGTAPRILFYIEDAIQDGVKLRDGSKRIIAKNIHFVELRENGEGVNAGYAPYLDYRAADEAETAVIRDFAHSQTWLTQDVEGRASSYAISKIIPEHLAEVKAKRQAMVDKTMKAVKERLTSEIQYHDYRANELKQKEQAGKRNARLNSDNEARKAEELEARMHKRLDELAQERKVSALPPVIIGGALVIPIGLLHKLMPSSTPVPTFSQGDRQATEDAGMNAVMLLEEKFGFFPHDRHKDNLGYDIESEIPQEKQDGTTCLRFIEVKGRVKGATDVIVTKNEILTALNKPDEFILALVEVDGDKTRATYLKRPFVNVPDFAANAVIFDIADLMRNAQVIYQE